MARPDALEVLAATCHPDTRRIVLDDRTVLRTPERPDDPRGNAVLLHDVPSGEGTIRLALGDAAVRLSAPGTTPRVVARAGGLPPADQPADVAAGGTRRRRTVLLLTDAAARAAGTLRRHDLTIAPPADGRGWHGVTVLRRHAVADDDAGEAAARARGGRDELLRWWVDGRRRLTAQGRARVLVATRFGTPVATGSLLWEPGVDVGPDAAGLAVVTDVVVHPAHRRLGVATSLVAELVSRHVVDFPRAMVATIAPPDLGRSLVAAGWRVHEHLVEVAVDPPAAGGSASAQR